MLQVLKDQVLVAQGHWLREIEASVDDNTTIDLSTDIVKIFQKFLVFIIFGEDVDEEISMKVITRSKEPNCDYEY